MSKRKKPSEAERSGGHRTAGEQGFTLIETLIASLVLLFGLVSIASLLGYAAATSYENKMDELATSLAVQKMEQLRGQSASTLADGGCSLDSSGYIDFSQSAVSGYGQTVANFNRTTFDLRWNVNTSSGLRKIVVAARRVNGGNKRLLTNVLKPVNVQCLKQP